MNEAGEEVCITIVYYETVHTVTEDEDCSNQDACYHECIEDMDEDDDNGYSLLPGGKVPAAADRS